MGIERLYENEYGKVKLTFVTKLMSIRDISSKLEIVKNNMISLEDSEVITLITQNKYIQICFSDSMKDENGDLKSFLFLHESASTGYVCKAEILKSSLPECMKAHQELTILNKTTFRDK